MKTFSGIPASPGIAIGKALLYIDNGLPEIPQYKIGKSKLPAEWKRLEKAVGAAIGEVKTLCEQTDGKQADIFQAHLMMLEDPYFLENLKERFYENGKNSEWTVNQVAKEVSDKLAASPDPLFKERSQDIHDVARRVIARLLGISTSWEGLDGLSEDTILVTPYLMPSNAMLLKKPYIKGLVMDGGSWNCHSAILARTFNSPAVLGISAFSKEAKGGQLLLVNGSAGTVLVDPDKETLALHKKLKKQTGRPAFSRTAALPAETTDGRRVAIKANIEYPQEAKYALEAGAEGIGLYRSEFLFISPQDTGSLHAGQDDSEEAQFNAYTDILKFTGDKPVTIRTTDLGGDKLLSGFKDSGVMVLGLQPLNENNPLLGLRAIRLSLSDPQKFKTQLRAILRAGVYGNLRLMFPMVTAAEELDAAIALLKEARAECKKKNQPVTENIETGIMIEVPSAALIADLLAKKADFFSIGTNDLLQYTFAADRENEKVSHLCDPYNPAALRLIKMTIEAAHKQGIKAAMCGELAGDPLAAVLLLGLGLDEFSMGAQAIHNVKQAIRGVSFETAQALAGECLAAESGKEIKALVKKAMQGKTRR
ncbi:MAG: phosphoenolpyruvate--protein phosphotransferase [Spirochaetes bacterium]|nr:phosphoenolpyruvate--protein phosphotransferase [Spirochaetota bacterium]